VLTYREAQDRHPVLPETRTPSSAQELKDCYFLSLWHMPLLRSGYLTSHGPLTDRSRKSIHLSLVTKAH
jgi:hypothetical protein